MPLAPVKTPQVVKSLFPNYDWNVNTSEKVIYLTFDDGPTPEITPWVINTLANYNAKATFFCIGANVEKHPEIFKDVLTNGHAIGNHTQNHVNGWKTSFNAYVNNIEDCEMVFNTQFKQRHSSILKLFRPPYGKITPKQGKHVLALGYKIIMWDVLSFDWDKSVSQESCLENVLSKTNKGSIVVFHDSVKAAKNMQYVLPKFLEYYTKAGYSFKALEV